MNEFENQSETLREGDEDVVEVEKGEKYDGGEIPRTEAVPEED